MHKSFKIFLVLTVLTSIFFVLILITGQGFHSSFNQQINQKIAKQKKAVKKISSNLSEKQNQIPLAKNKNQNESPKQEQKNNSLINNNQAQINPLASLDLELLAVAEIGKQQFATIRFNQKSQSYQINQNISQDLILKKIYPNFVILDYHHQSFRLKLSEDQKQFSDITKVQHPKTEIKKKVNQYQKMIIEDPYALIGLIDIQSYQKVGVRGYQLKSSIDKKLFNELGFQDGDVLLTINRLPITNEMNFKKLFKDLTTKKQFAIRLIRKGVELEYLLVLS